MSPQQSGIAVIEGKWSERTNTSVRSLFDVLSDIHFGNPHSYIYEMFCDNNSLGNIVSRMGADQTVRYLYIGAHGSPDAVCGHGGNVSRTKLKNTLLKLKNGTVAGLFLGTCFFGREENASFLLNPPNDSATAIKWVAGYTRKIDWIDSSVLDLLFWNKFLLARGKPTEKIKEAGDEIMRLAPGLAKELGFCLYTRKTGPGGGVKNLIL